MIQEDDSMRNLCKRAYKAITAFALVITMLFSAGIFTPAVTEANDIGIPVTYLMDHPRGEINTHGEDVDAYTTQYMKGGPMEIQWHVGNGWHIYATMSYYVYGITWYYCIDSDDGDIYGWIDGAYIDFYSSTPNYTPITYIYSVGNRRGEIDGNGVYGYTTDYVYYGGAKKEQHKVQDAWNITAKNTCYSHGVTWYECWDTDDGDYYGWIDASFLSFYDERPPATTPKPTEPATTPAPVVQTVIVTEYVTEPAIIATEPAITVTETAVAAVKEENNSEISMAVIILIVGAVILLLIIIAILLIVLLMKKSKPAVQNVQQPYFQPAMNRQSNGQCCPECGAAKTDPNSIYCENCGSSFEWQ